MGPRSENRGYDANLQRELERERELQWVHGARTVVMPPRRPRLGATGGSFNGSTVREPWSSSTPFGSSARSPASFNGSTVREPYLCSFSRRALGCIPVSARG